MTEEDKTKIENFLEIMKGNGKTSQHFIDSQVTIDNQRFEKYEEFRIKCKIFENCVHSRSYWLSFIKKNHK